MRKNLQQTGMSTELFSRHKLDKKMGFKVVFDRGGGASPYIILSWRNYAELF